MYPYLLKIFADGKTYTTRHKTYMEALAMQIELESQFGRMINIELIFREPVKASELIW